MKKKRTKQNCHSNQVKIKDKCTDCTAHEPVNLQYSSFTFVRTPYKMAGSNGAIVVCLKECRNLVREAEEG